MLSNANLNQSDIFLGVVAGFPERINNICLVASVSRLKIIFDLETV